MSSQRLLPRQALSSKADKRELEAAVEEVQAVFQRVNPAHS